MACVGVVGLGSIAQRHCKNLKHCLPNVEIFGVSSSGRTLSTTEGGDFQILPSLTSLLEKKPAFVIIASPSSYHLQHSEVFTRAGIPVLVEKPLTASLHDAVKFCELEKHCSVPIGLGYCLRFLPELIEIRKFMNSGILGKVLLVESSVGQYLPDWRNERDYRESVSARVELGGGVLLELSHELDYLRYLLGPLNFTHGVLRKADLLEIEVESVADLNLVSEQGVLCTVHMDFLQKIPRRSCIITGVDGRLEWNLLTSQVDWISTEERKTIYYNETLDPNDKYLDMLKNLVATIEGEDNRGATLQDGVATIKLIQQIKEKSIWGQAV